MSQLYWIQFREYNKRNVDLRDPTASLWENIPSNKAISLLVTATRLLFIYNV
ncbi:hypothetical protein HMPREF3226_02745 [Prevotella corporis]|uniref:Uncharacterized protein n=1 Tax=Prevotella corporis TaxID=28128 RepID=A0A133PTV7_9BACT|nr:hypothetical protein HMPREF3226_02745 [Prevotella corporis]